MYKNLRYTQVLTKLQLIISLTGRQILAGVDEIIVPIVSVSFINLYELINGGAQQKPGVYHAFLRITFRGLTVYF